MEEQTLFGLIHRDTLYSYSKIVVDYMMIFAPSIGYIAQAMKFQQTKSSAGFSKYICLILLFANILRIFFWIGKRFTVVLLYQSLVVIGSQFYLLYSCIKYGDQVTHSLPTFNEKEEINQLKNAKMSIIARLFDVKKFWMWERMMEYYLFTVFFIIVLIFIFKVMGHENYFFINTIGAISAFSESIIAIPQIKTNYFNRDVSNLSALMILLWLGGDSFKTVYYILSASPGQFIVCGVLQVCLDITLTTQLYYYSPKVKINKTAEPSTTPMKNVEETISLIKSKDNSNNENENEDQEEGEELNINIANQPESTATLKNANNNETEILAKYK